MVENTEKSLGKRSWERAEKLPSLLLTTIPDHPMPIEDPINFQVKGAKGNNIKLKSYAYKPPEGM